MTAEVLSNLNHFYRRIVYIVYRTLVVAALVRTVQLVSLDSQTNDIAVCALRDGQANVANKVKNKCLLLLCMSLK